MMVLVVCAGMMAVVSRPAHASEAEEKLYEATVSGEIVSTNRQALSVEYAKTNSTSEEMLLPVDDKVEVSGPKSLAELKPGDRVSVSYRQTYREDKDGQRIVLKTMATKISLLRSATGKGVLLSTDEGIAK